jgi:hypothetical protein
MPYLWKFSSVSMLPTSAALLMRLDSIGYLETGDLSLSFVKNLSPNEAADRDAAEDQN